MSVLNTLELLNNELNKVTETFWNKVNTKCKTVSDFECVCIVPPLPWTENIYIPTVKRDVTPLFVSEKISGALKSGIARSIYDLIAELPRRLEKKWFLYDNVLQDYFIRKGPYLYSKINEADYDDFVRHCLDCNLAVSPAFDIPSIVPYGADKGVFSLLKNNPWKKGL